MVSHVERHDFAVPPPSLDEGYWSSLLNDGEYSPSTHGVETAQDDEHLFEHDDVGKHYLSDFYTPDNGDWDEIQRIVAHDEAVVLQVIGYNRGGLWLSGAHCAALYRQANCYTFPLALTRPCGGARL